MFGVLKMLTRILFGFAVLACFTYVKCDKHAGHHHDENESLQSALNATASSYQHAKEHVNHMVPLVNQQTHDQIVAINNEAIKKLAAELSQLSTELDNKVKSGEHTEALKNTIHAAVTNLQEQSAKLNQLSGTDVAALNTGYFEAVDAALQDAKNIAAAGACPEIDPVLVKGLHDITHLYNEYQDTFHAAVGAHDSSSSSSSSGHHDSHGSGDHHHHHHHHSAHAPGAHQSSEESVESNESHTHGPH